MPPEVVVAWILHHFRPEQRVEPTSKGSDDNLVFSKKVITLRSENDR